MSSVRHVHTAAVDAACMYCSERERTLNKATDRLVAERAELRSLRAQVADLRHATAELWEKIDLPGFLSPLTQRVAKEAHDYLNCVEHTRENENSHE